MNIVWAYCVYFVANVILYRRDWRNLRERRSGRTAIYGSGKVGTSATARFDVAKTQPKLIDYEKEVPGRQLTIRAEDSMLGAHSEFKTRDPFVPRQATRPHRQSVMYHDEAGRSPSPWAPTTDPKFDKD